MALIHKTLKWGIFTSSQSGNNEIERYIVEDLMDFESFLCRFPVLHHVYSGAMVDTIRKDLLNGKTVIFSDTHPSSGIPSYCYENTTGCTHPSSFNRMRLGAVSSN